MRWFRKKTFGYGWTPCAWQGWVVTLVFTAVIIAIAAEKKTLGPTNTLVAIGVLVVAFFAVTAFTSGKDSDA